MTDDDKENQSKRLTNEELARKLFGKRVTDAAKRQIQEVEGDNEDQEDDDPTDHE